MSNNRAPKIKDSAKINIKGRETSTYAGKLDFAHQNGMKALAVRILQAASEDNQHTCICEATLRTKDDCIFTDIADASPDNVPPGCRDRYTTVASTRAKSRVMSDAYNIPSSFDEDHNENVIDAEFEVVASHNRRPLPLNPGGGDKPITQKQMKYITKLAPDGTHNALSNSKYGKNIDDLTGGEANNLIQQLKPKL